MRRPTRRSVLKGLVAAGLAATSGAGLLAGAAAAQELIPAGAAVSRTTGTPRRAIPSVCGQCPARCGILGFVEAGALVKLEGNPRDPNSRGGVCARGLAGANLLDNPDRLLYPLRRTGPRGAGKWQRISWDEALDEVGALLGELRASGRPGEFVFEAGLEAQELAVGRFLRAYGQPTVAHELALFSANRAAATRRFWGAAPAVPDVANARYVLSFGANPYESGPYHVPLAQRLVEARLQGARLVTFDPRLSNTATRSDQWLAPLPSTDGVVVAALAHVVLKLGLHDADFLRRWLALPLDALRASLEPYTPARAAALSGVPAREIERIAREFAATRPAVVLTGGGLSHHSNGFAGETAALLLAALTGNLDAPGGLCLPRRYELGEPAEASVPPQELFRRLQSGELRARLFLAYGANPAYTHPDPRRVAETLADERRVGKLVVVDSALTETAALADLVLPAATYLESWDLQSPPAFTLVPYVALRQPVVGPVGESRSFYDLAAELALRVGGGMEESFADSAEQAVAAAAAGVAGLAEGLGFAGLRERGVWQDERARPDYRAYAKSGFPTPSGQLEVEPAALAPASLELRPSAETSGLHLVIYQTALHFRGRTAGQKWLAEIAHDNAAWMHPETAAARGLRPGTKVRLTSPTGALFVRLDVTQAVRPDVVALADGFGHWQGGAFATAAARRSADPDSARLWWGKHGNGAHVQRLVAAVTDPLGGGQGWEDTYVVVEPAPTG